jgi:hypothetical protein
MDLPFAGINNRNKIYCSVLDLEPTAGKNTTINLIYCSVSGIISLTVKFNI